jgi:hypothetical protein
MSPPASSNCDSRTTRAYIHIIRCHLTNFCRCQVRSPSHILLRRAAGRPRPFIHMTDTRAVEVSLAPEQDEVCVGCPLCIERKQGVLVVLRGGGTSDGVEAGGKERWQAGLFHKILRTRARRHRLECLQPLSPRQCTRLSM